MQDDSDATVLIRRPIRRRWIWAVFVGVGLLAGAGTATFLLQPGRQELPPQPLPQILPQVRPQVRPQVPPVTAPAPVESLPALATEAEILARPPGPTETFRFALWPAIVIVQFASLSDQAGTLNRAAALIEKAGMPRDQVLEPAELERRIRAAGDTPDTYYYGHDYRAADLLRFFDILTAGGQPPTQGEATLRAAMQAWGWRPGSTGALITLAQNSPGTKAALDPAARAAILRHELSHGMYFTDTAYASYARRFWTTILTEGERARFRAFLAKEGYDTGIEDLVINETQAYLVHTRDTRYFDAQAVDISATRIDALRALFVLDMPPSWLRDCTPPGR